VERKQKTGCFVRSSRLCENRRRTTGLGYCIGLDFILPLPFDFMPFDFMPRRPDVLLPEVVPLVVPIEPLVLPDVLP